MTGMQVNPGTPCDTSMTGYQEIDIARIIPALGIEHFWMVDPFELEETTEVIRQGHDPAGRQGRSWPARNAPSRPSATGKQAGKVRGCRRKLQPVQAVPDGHRLLGHQPG